MNSSKWEWIEFIAEKEAKKIRFEDSTESRFKKPGIKNQHTSCTNLLKAIEDALEALENGEVETVRTTLKEGN